MAVIALIVAAGSGERLGMDGPKALVELAGRTLLQRSVDVLQAVPAIEQIVVALPPGADAPGGTSGVQGGRVRSESVRLALAAGTMETNAGAGAGVEAGAGARAGAEAEAGVGDTVLVHDAARPLVTPALVQATIRALEADESLDGAIAAAPMTDTVKRVGDDGVVRETLDRRELWAVQTPQVFRRAALERALDVPDEVLAQATDDAWLVERAGGRVAVVESSRENLKITTPHDLVVAEMLLASRPG
jgi:2-C-methyl-D-erythritol 4-phosphate cytidylyltransferase